MSNVQTHTCIEDDGVCCELRFSVWKILQYILTIKFQNVCQNVAHFLLQMASLKISTLQCNALTLHTHILSILNLHKGKRKIIHLVPAGHVMVPLTVKSTLKSYLYHI